jgi:predicted nucleic acid-binding protein
MNALFDTNILIDYLNGQEPAQRELGRYPRRLISVVTWMELLVGGHNDAETDVLEMFMRRTHRLRLPDAIIWASARANSALLVTRNTKVFPATEPDVRRPY